MKGFLMKDHLSDVLMQAYMTLMLGLLDKHCDWQIEKLRVFGSGKIKELGA